MRNAIVLIVAASLVAACTARPETPAATSSTTVASSTEASSSTTAVSATAATTTNTPEPPTHSEEDLVALASGAVVVQRPHATDSNGEAWFLFDEDPGTGWTSASKAWSEPTVVELPDRSVIKVVQFDTASAENDGRVPDEVEVAVSDQGPKEGFQPIARVVLSRELKDGQTFPVTADVPGRWVRMQITRKEGGSEIVQIQEFRAFGERQTHNNPPNVTGTWKTDAGNLHLKQEGMTVTGCFETGGFPISGGMEGRLLKFSWHAGESGNGPAIAIFGSEGYLFGGWWRTDGASEKPKLDPFEGHRKSAEPGNCPNWKAPQDQMAADIRKTGRVRLYGIDFDSDSDHIRDESKGTLDTLVTMLKSNADLRITVEGHTDSSSTPEHNQSLSEQRATAVKRYLAGAGIDAARLSTAGLGSTKPVASNDTALGRASNRRVELVKM